MTLAGCVDVKAAATRDSCRYMCSKFACLRVFKILIHPSSARGRNDITRMACVLKRTGVVHSVGNFWSGLGCKHAQPHVQP